MSFTLTACPRVLFNAANTQLAQTTRRKTKIKMFTFEAAPPTSLLFMHKAGKKTTQKKDVLGVRIEHFFCVIEISHTKMLLLVC